MNYFLLPFTGSQLLLACTYISRVLFLCCIKLTLPKPCWCAHIGFVVHLPAIDFEFKRISDLLCANGYPKKLIDSCIKSVLRKCYSPEIPVHTVSRKELLIVLPFTGKHGLMVRTKLTRILRKLYPMATLRVVFTSKTKIGHFFKFKEIIPTMLRSLVVYEFRCSSCNARYVGQTARHLTTRVCEHMGISPRTKRPLASPHYSAIREHCQVTGHAFGPNNFKVLNRSANKLDLGIMESLQIQNSLPALNNMLSATELHLFKQ